MKRIIKNKAIEIKCEICNKMFSSYALSSHLIYSHKTNGDEYALKYGEFRKGKYKSKNKRQINKIKCMECKETFSSIGMFTHLRDTHSMIVEKYIELYGEFRQRYLNKKMIDDEICLICNDSELYNTKSLTWHLKQNHNINKMDYVKNVILKVIPKCKCGCGEEINIVDYKPYIIREYLAGHNSKGETNPMFGKTFSLETTEKMRLRALERIHSYHLSGTTPPFLKQSVIDFRVQNMEDKMIDKIQTDYNITILKYSRNPDVSYDCKCNVCNTEFYQPHEWYFYCPKCYPKYKSRAEKEILDFINDKHKDIKIIKNSRSILSNGKEIDLYFPEQNFAIEFDGLYWHGESMGKTKKYHIDKTNEMETKGIHLIHVFEDEWINYKEIVLSKIEQKLNIFSGIKIYARKCEIKEVNFTDCSNFLNLYHLQGTDSSSIRFGLYYNNELISIMTFGKQNASRGVFKPIDGEYELSRFCVKDGYLCVGGASKLFKYFIKSKNPNKIYTYADRRWSKSDNNLYDSIGFEKVGQTDPGYWYFKDCNKRYHRFNFTKKKTVELGGNPNKTEWENMIEMGYDRIWDCGHLKYEWNREKTPSTA